MKAIRWASDRIGTEEGVIAFVTNNSFLDAVAFDGMRKHLSDNFDTIYILDLGGNVKKNPKLSGTTHNVFSDSGWCKYQFLHQEALTAEILKLEFSTHTLMNFGVKRTNITISIQSSITETSNGSR